MSERLMLARKCREWARYGPLSPDQDAAKLLQILLTDVSEFLEAEELAIRRFFHPPDPE